MIGIIIIRYRENDEYGVTKGRFFLTSLGFIFEDSYFPDDRPDVLNGKIIELSDTDKEAEPGREREDLHSISIRYTKKHFEAGDGGEG